MQSVHLLINNIMEMELAQEL